MTREYKTIEDLYNRAKEMHHAYNLIGSENLNEEGKAEAMAYCTICDAFEFSSNEADFINLIREEIAGCCTRVTDMTIYELMMSRSYDGFAEVRLLRKYVRHNFKRELWENFPEFKKPTT